MCSVSQLRRLAGGVVGVGRRNSLFVSISVRDRKDRRSCTLVSVGQRLRLRSSDLATLEVILGRMDGRRLAALSHWSLTKV